jgi:hypothetical protein
MENEEFDSEHYIKTAGMGKRILPVQATELLGGIGSQILRSLLVAMPDSIREEYACSLEEAAVALKCCDLAELLAWDETALIDAATVGGEEEARVMWGLESRDAIARRVSLAIKAEKAADVMSPAEGVLLLRRAGIRVFHQLLDAVAVMAIEPFTIESQSLYRQLKGISESQQTASATVNSTKVSGSESLVVQIDMGDGTLRDALPVRAIPYVTGWEEQYGIEPQTLANRLKPLEGADFTKWHILAYKLVNDKPVAVKRSEWRVVENRAASYSKRLHKQFPRNVNGKVNVEGLAEWQTESAKELPQGVFVWFDEFKDAYCNYYKFQEVILPEPDPAPLLLSMQTKKMVLEGFEQAMLAAPEVTLGVSANDNERGAKLNAMLDRMNDPAYRRDLELVEVQSARLEKARERFAKWNEIGDGGTSVGLDLKETRLGDAKQELDELEERHKVMRGDIFPEPKTATVEANKKWTPAKLAELAIFRGAHTMPETAAQYGISEQRIRQLLPSKKPKASPFTGLIHRTK